MNVNKDAFQRSKPICVSLSQITFRKDQTSIVNDKRLPDLLSTMSQLLSDLLSEYHTLPSKLGDYLFVPISAMLKTCKEIPQPITTILLELLSNLIRLCWSSSESIDKNTFKQLFSLSTFMISSDLENEGLNQRAEEFQLAAAKLLNSLYLTWQFRHWDNSMLPSIAHSITILLAMAENGSLSLQIEALETLYTLFGAVADGEMLSNVIPGNVSSFTKILSRPGISTHYTVVCTTLSAFQELVTIVYDDKKLDVHLKRDAQGEVIVEIRNPGKHRETKWLKATSIQLNKALITAFGKLIRRSNDTINNALYEFCTNILSKSGKSLHVCSELLIKTALSVGKGELDELKEYQNEIGAILRSSNFHITTEFQEETQYTMCKNAIRVLDSDLLSRLQIPRKVLYQISESLRDHIAKPITESRRNFVQVQPNALTLTTIIPSRIGSSQFKLPHVSTETYNHVFTAIVTLGSMMTDSDLQQQVADLLSQPLDVTRDPAVPIWVLSNLIMGFKTSTTDIFLDIDDDNNDSTSYLYDVLEAANEYIATLAALPQWNELQSTNITMSLYAIKQMIVCMGPQFKYEMLDYIYNVVECFANENEEVRNISGEILLTLAELFYNESMTELLKDNVDYLVDGISIRVDNCMFQRAYTVLHVLIKFSGYDLVERLKDILEKLFRMLEYYHGYDDLCVVLLDLFREVAAEIAKSFLTGSGEAALELRRWNADPFEPWGASNIEQVLDLLDKERVLQEAEGADPEVPEQTAEQFFTERFQQDSDDEDEDEDGEDIQESAQEEVWESPIPKPAYSLLLRFWTYADRLLTHSSRRVRSRALQLLVHLCPMLSTQQTAFLPNVAKVWDITVHLSNSPDAAQAASCYTLLSELVMYTDSFLMKRVQEMWALFRKCGSVEKCAGSAVPSLDALLVTAINQFSMQLPDLTVQDMCRAVRNRDLHPKRGHCHHVINIRIFLQREKADTLPL